MQLTENSCNTGTAVKSACHIDTKIFSDLCFAIGSNSHGSSSVPEVDSCGLWHGDRRTAVGQPHDQFVGKLLAVFFQEVVLGVSINPRLAPGDDLL